MSQRAKGSLSLIRQTNPFTFRASLVRLVLPNIALFVERIHDSVKPAFYGGGAIGNLDELCGFGCCHFRCLHRNFYGRMLSQIS